MAGDSAYSSKNNVELLKERGYIPIIAYNKRNTQNESIIKENEFNKEQEAIYKKRTIIETFFSWIKNFPVVRFHLQENETRTSILVMYSMFCSAKH